MSAYPGIVMKEEDWWRDKEDRRRNYREEDEDQGYELFASTDM